jgi:hypothetical protein
VVGTVVLHKSLGRAALHRRNRLASRYSGIEESARLPGTS